MNTIRAIFEKELKELRSNRPMLMQFLLYPIITVIMNNLVKEEGIPELMYVKMFSVMFMTMATVITTSSIIAEEKEKGTLRTLMMSNVNPLSYLAGIGLFDFILCMLGAVIIAVGCNMESSVCVRYLGLMAIGFIINIALGAGIGTLSKNQLHATSLAIPFTLIMSFLPLLGVFNDTISKVAEYTLGQQMLNLMEDLNRITITSKGAVILAANTLLFVVLFVFAYRKRGLD